MRLIVNKTVKRNNNSPNDTLTEHIYHSLNVSECLRTF